MSWRRVSQSAVPRRRRGFVWLALLAVAVTIAALLFTARPTPVPAERYAFARVPTSQLSPLWQVPAFSFPDQRGEKVTATSLLGRPWIADFIFTGCTSACPLMTARMVMLQRILSGVDVRFVSFSVDPEHDTPAVLDGYARTWNASEARWQLLATERTRLPETLDGFHVTATGVGDGIVHSSVFLLVDSTGWVRGVYDSDDPAARDALTTDVRKLQPKSMAAPVASGTTGLLASLGCAGCHSNPRIAPPLGGIAGTERQMTTGTAATADDAYLLRSIVEPGKEIVAGYAAVMPSYRGQLSDSQLSALVQEVKELPAERTPTPTATTVLAVDPVCHMTVRAEAGTLHEHYQGRDIYFCSETCRASFLANPGKFSSSGK